MSTQNQKMNERANTSTPPNRRRGPGGGHGMFSGGGAKARDFKGTMKKLLDYLNAYRLQFMVVIFSIYGPTLLGEATTAIFEGIMGKFAGTSDGIDFSVVGKIIVTLTILYGLSALFAYIQGFIMSGVSMKISYQMRRDISEKINKMPLRYFDTTTNGEVLSRITNDVDTVSRTLNQSLGQIITSATTVVGVFIMMLRINLLMTIVALLIVPLSMLLVISIVKRSQKYFKQQQDYLGNVNGHIEEMYGGHVIVKAFNGEKKSAEQFEVLNEKLYGSAWKAQFLSGMMRPAMNIIGNVGYVAVCVLGGALAANGTIAVGQIQAFIQYVRNFTQPIAQLANISNVLQQTAAAAERVFEFLGEDDEIAETTDPHEFNDVEGHVRFNNVQFAYNDEAVVINNFSTSVSPGQRVAIVGPTGAGKTTMVKLLMRFYDVKSGSIEVDGVDIRNVTRQDLRNQFGMVLQDTWLYNDTIMENIRYGRLDATDEEVIEAAKAAHVDTFVHMLPKGYEMVLNEDTSNVSQGQKQLITIARAILADPKLLILDEATSSVDTRTEVQIQKAMNNLMQNRTSFIIAHRLSTIRDADLILVMDHGDIVEQGTHDDLLKAQGFYANLYNSQFEDIDEAS